MIANALSPTTRVMLDRRIAEERLTPVDPPFERPDWLYELGRFSFVPHAIVMGADGAVARRRVLADEVDWHRVVAVRFETPFGDPIDLDDLVDDEDYH